MSDNVTPITDELTLLDIEHDLIQKKLDKVFSNGNYILAYYDKGGDVKYFRGQKLTIGELTYLQKVINIKMDNDIEGSMFGD